MYYRHDLHYEYPDRCDQHMIEVPHLWDVNCDADYPYLQKSLWFKLQRAFLWTCLHTILPIAMWVRHGLRIHGKEKMRQYKDLVDSGIITVSNHVFMWDFIGIMQCMRPKLGYFPAWQTNLEGPNGPLIRMAGGIPIPNHNMRAMVMFKKAMDEVLQSNKWMHFFPEGSMWYYYPDIRPLKKAVFKYAVRYNRPVLPFAYTFRPRKGIWKLWGYKPLVDLHIGDPIYPDKTLPIMDATRKLQSEVYHAMQMMCGITPDHPSYRTEQDIETYQKTM